VWKHTQSFTRLAFFREKLPRYRSLKTWNVYNHKVSVLLLAYPYCSKITIEKPIFCFETCNHSQLKCKPSAICSVKVLESPRVRAGRSYFVCKDKVKKKKKKRARQIPVLWVVPTHHVRLRVFRSSKPVDSEGARRGRGLCKMLVFSCTRFTTFKGAFIRNYPHCALSC